jgi:hypothetical protein
LIAVVAPTSSAAVLLPIIGVLLGVFLTMVVVAGAPAAPALLMVGASVAAVFVAACSLLRVVLHIVVVMGVGLDALRVEVVCVGGRGCGQLGIIQVLAVVVRVGGGCGLGILQVVVLVVLWVVGVGVSCGLGAGLGSRLDRLGRLGILRVVVVAVVVWVGVSCRGWLGSRLASAALLLGGSNCGAMVAGDGQLVL